MSRLSASLNKLPQPIIGLPLFIISKPKLVIKQCRAGMAGFIPALNARPVCGGGLICILRTMAKASLALHS